VILDWLARTKSLIGEDSVAILQKSKVAVVGLGGVGGSTCEALCRAGIGSMLIADFDIVDTTNINRQIIATIDSVGRKKTEVMKERLKSINPHINLTCVDKFISEESGNDLFDFSPDFVVDAVDSVSAKLYIIKKSQELSLPVISCMGTGNRTDPTKLRIGKIEDTLGNGCPLARIMLKESSKKGIASFKTIYSTELPVKVSCEDSYGKHSPASISFVPPVAGYIIASEVVKELISKYK